jgi:hypothetical protein
MSDEELELGRLGLSMRETPGIGPMSHQARIVDLSEGGDDAE